MVNEAGVVEVSLHTELQAFNLNFSFVSGPGFTVLFGPSGCGKTTALNCIAGLATPAKGRVKFPHAVLFDSKSGINLTPQERKVGYVFQKPSLFPHLTVAENIDFGMTDQSLRAQLVEQFQIDHLLSRRPSSLSGGQAQKVLMVRALAAKPKALLLDEPFNALDLNSRQHVIKILHGLQADWQIPVFLVTHSMEEARAMGQTIVFMSDGKVDSIEPTVMNDVIGGKS